MKYLMTNDALIIKGENGPIQFSKQHPNFKEILEQIKDATNIKDVLDTLVNLSYEDDDIIIEQEIGSDIVEIFYNGKYFNLDDRLKKEFLRLKSLNDGFTIKKAVPFIKKLLNNPYHSMKSFLDKLYEVKFYFIHNGNIIITKHYEEESIGRTYDRRRNLKCLDNVMISHVEINPSDLDESFNYEEYKCLFVCMSPELGVLGCTYVGSNPNIFRLASLGEHITTNRTKEELLWIKQINEMTTKQGDRKPAEHLAYVSRKLESLNGVKNDGLI